MRRLTATAAATALTVVAALTGCATTTGPTATETTRETATSTPTKTATQAASTPTPTPSATATAVADPKAVEPYASASVPSTSVSALAQHIYDQCSIGAAAAGVRLRLTENPSGYTESDGHYQLVYPFTFLDGHDDPYAIYNCGLTNSTVTSKFISGGISDTH